MVTYLSKVDLESYFLLSLSEARVGQEVM